VKTKSINHSRNIDFEIAFNREISLKFLFISVLIILSLLFPLNGFSRSDTNDVLPDTSLVLRGLNQYFKNCNTEGCIVIFDNNNKSWIVSDSLMSKSEKLPASTFKIMNLLIALETGVITNENQIVKWPGETDTVKYGYRPDIYHDLTVKEAFEVSARWVFNELAKKIGKENYKHYLTVCNYGNKHLSEPGDDFWNFGEFGISPLNQVDFMRNLNEGKLPFSQRNMEIVKRVMITEQTDNYVISAKTGWTRENGFNTGWWVGFVKTKQGVWYFATLLLQDWQINSANFSSCRKEITKAVFNDLGVIKD
jgi:beta-lactamase class D